MIDPLAGTLFDFGTITTKQNFEKLCRKKGYDGLAVINSPEALKVAMKLAKQDFRDFSKIFIGLRYRPETRSIAWDDGTPVASDTPEMSDVVGNTKTPYGRLSDEGTVNLGTGLVPGQAICGMHKNLATEAHGYTVHGQQPVGVSSSLFQISVFSYLECAVVCGQDNRCKAAEFKTNELTCAIFGPGSYDLDANSNSITYVRNRYP
ncbi:hypothetical protein PoB_004682900 [Plakobranchus ocellatus]|uniref:C-type lectin domain-containing protein n=1 Tax=Plakobranchus ocellatus TaxID=259542 RepID=A0AAV4BPS9_9GAST|nr:hypothetical protein PoB_004682900 [Plakobranchus ocellatus]